MSASTDPYHAVPYESFSYPQSHPGRLATIATLFAMSPAPLDGARVMEIGCASGGNLLPLAAAYPGSKFVGIDLSERHIADARAGVDALKLGNVQLHAGGLEEVGEMSGSFDYIIAHGIYSWVTAPVREKLMALCKSRLAPSGIAYISYNTFPGSSARAALRNMVRFRTRKLADPVEQISQTRSFFAFVELAMKERNDAYGQSMREEVSEAANSEDFYIAHEYLEETNEPCYFHEFIEIAEQHGLQFLGEAEMQSMSASGFSSSVRSGLQGMAKNMVEAEQYGDFLKNRAFRQTLLCHSGIELKRAISPDRIRDFHVASSAELIGGEVRPNTPAQFRDADGVIIQAADPLTKAMLLELREVWPRAIRFTDLLEKTCVRAGLALENRTAVALGNCLLACYATSRAIEFQINPPQFCTFVSEFPMATELSRWQAGRSSRVTNLRHENIVLGVVESALLKKLDGLHGIGALEAKFSDARAILNRFAGGALLIA
ncbi:MAG: hypothetical protein JWL59_3738 [Chthoniobacteraceae bacterium]|nr:hypothetical protein [Chthoniobacteraceae bacterium]